jgi:ketosteroid isomerase-like protein
MPAPATLEAFVATVEAGRFVEAIERFYADEATMQENHRPPRVGKAALIANERKVIEGTRSVKARCLRPVFVNGDQVVVRWLFEFEDRLGVIARIDELALQRWRGERIVQERFFYDPAQMKPAGT